jgi:hypothetical protein
MRARLIGTTLLLLALTGCATVSQGPLQRIVIESDPSGATVDASRCGVSIGALETPTTIMVSRRAKRCQISLSHSGYYTAVVPLERVISDRLEGNFDAMEIASCDDCDGSFYEWMALAVVGLAGALTGVVVDAASGAMYELQPSTLFVALEPLDAEWDEHQHSLDDQGHQALDHDECGFRSPDHSTFAVSLDTR